MSLSGIRAPSKKHLNPIQITDEVLDRCIDIYMSTGKMAAVGKAIGRSRAWVGQMFKDPRCVDRMKTRTLAIVNNNPNVANIEECMTKLTSIMRGEQLKELSDRVQKVVKESGDAIQISESIKGITKFTPQVENNQIKAVTMLLTAQGALDPRKAARDDHHEIIDDIVLALVKSRSIDSVLAKLNVEVIDVTSDPQP